MVFGPWLWPKRRSVRRKLGLWFPYQKLVNPLANVAALGRPRFYRRRHSGGQKANSVRCLFTRCDLSRTKCMHKMPPLLDNDRVNGGFLKTALKQLIGGFLFPKKP